MQAQDPRVKQNVLLYRLRWIVPVTLSLLGLAYVLGETFIQHDHYTPGDQLQVVVGVVMLSIVGPVITYLGLDWALKTSSRLEAAEQVQREQNRQLAIIAEVSRVANRSLDVQRVLNDTLDTLMQLVGAESGAIWLRRADHLELQAANGVSNDFLADESIQTLDQCICGQALKEELPLTLADLKCGREFLDARCRCEAFVSAIGVPVRTGDQVIGILELGSDRAREFSQPDRELLAAVGYQIGSAVQKARLHQELQRLNEDLERLVDERTGELLLAQKALAGKAETLRELLVRVHDVEEATRARIAGDLHDGVQQLLNGALFETQALRQALNVDPLAAEQQLEQLQNVLQQIEIEMRAAIYSLRPATLDSLGLAPALQECVRTFERASSTPCQLTVEGTPRRFDAGAELAAFRIVQEALNNVDAHAQASHSSVLLRFEPHNVRLEIHDDGVGFDMGNYSNNNGSQLGLIGMQERAESVGGYFTAQSAANQGTHITLNLPLEKNQQ